jgi:hypothetical protein
MQGKIMERENMRFFYEILLAGIAVLLFSGCTTTKTATTTKSHHLDTGQQEEVVLAPSSFHEACEKLSPGQKAAFSFSTSKPVDFNVHYHTMEGAVYSMREENIASKSGEVSAEVKATYCCMWTNNHSGPVSLNYEFRVVE